jgi:hypothetical protein
LLRRCLHPPSSGSNVRLAKGKAKTSLVFFGLLRGDHFLEDFVLAHHALEQAAECPAPRGHAWFAGRKNDFGRIARRR